MKRNRADTLIKRLYAVALVVALFTGFGNMPIYKRYYISAVPGLGWSGNFYINLYVHYIAGAVLLGIAAYYLVLYLKALTRQGRLTITGTLRAVGLGVTLISGVVLAARNLSGINLAFVPQMTTAFIHLGAVMALVVLSVGCGIAGSPWRRRR